MAKPTFGLEFTRTDGEARPVTPADMSVVGLIGIAEGADPTAFPLNTPVLVRGSDTALIGKLGAAADNTLKPAIDGVLIQLAIAGVSGRFVIVRVAKGTGADEAARTWSTIANLVGSPGSRTGVFAWRLSGPLLGVVPRLLGVAGNFTGQQRSGVGTIAATTPGTGYATPPTVAIAAPPAGGRQATATATVVAGSVTGFVITDPGEGYVSAPAITLSGGGGTGAAASATLALLANPLCQALASVAGALFAHAVVSSPGTSTAADKAWRATLNSFRLIGVTPTVKVTQADGSSATLAGVPYILGIGVRRDAEKGGRPFHSWANQPVYGIEGPSRPIEFSLTDGDVEGQELLAVNLGVIVRGEPGVDEAISDGGFVFVGTDNLGDDELWRFYSVTRGRDYLHLMFLRAVKVFFGKFNLTGQTVQAVENTMKDVCEFLQSEGDILGYRLGFKPDTNTVSEFRRGWFYLHFAGEEAPVFRGLGISSSRYRPAVEATLENLLTLADSSAI